MSLLINKTKKLISEINNDIKNLKNVISFKNLNFKLDVLRSNVSATDNKLKDDININEPVPEYLDLRNYMLPIRNQGPKGSCVAHAVCAMKEYQDIKEGVLNEYLSPWFVYLLRKDNLSSGMTIKDALEILKTRGVCKEKNFPYEKALTKYQISFIDSYEAKNFRIIDYSYLSTLKEIKISLNKKGPCIISLPCYNSTSTFWKKNNNDKLLGDHAVCVVGYDKDKGLLIRNSWGENWGEKGYTWFPYSDWGIQLEAWTTLDDKSKKKYSFFLSSQFLVPLISLIILSLIYYHYRKDKIRDDTRYLYRMLDEFIFYLKLARIKIGVNNVNYLLIFSTVSLVLYLLYIKFFVN
jgi:hypothetical protein